MSRSIALGMLRQGNIGNDLLNILDMIADEIEQTNIQDCADHYAAISTPTLDEVAF